jgi:hypothetical protein
MTRVAVVGDSHVGAIKLGWDRLAARHPELKIEFFAAPGSHFNRISMFEPFKFGLPAESDSGTGARLDKLNGRRWIDLARADVVVLVGRDGGFMAAASLLADHDVDGLPEGRSRRLSHAAFDTFCDAIAEQSVPGGPWRGWGRPRLFLLPRTRPAENLLRFRPKVMELRAWRRLARTPGKLGAGLALYRDRLEPQLAAAGIGLLDQPAASLSDNGLTREDMTRGSLRIDGDDGHSEADATHANAEYGALFWDTYAPRLAHARQPA